MSNRNAEFVSQQQGREIRRRAKQVDSIDFFNLITGPELLDKLEVLLPEYRERKFPPTVTLAMFLGQVLRADSYAWMTPEEYAAYPAEPTLREVKVRKKVLVTSFLNPREVCKREVGKLFLRRWNVELDLRNIKSTLGMERLTCKSPDMCEKEAWVYGLAYNLIRLLMAEAAVQAGVLPRQLSFKHTVQVWVAWSQRQFLSTAPEDTAALFRLIAHVRVGNRPGRIELRLIKTRPKPFSRLQTTRRRARANIRKYGRPKKLTA